LLQYTADNGLSASIAIRQDDNDAFGSFDTYRFAGKKMFGAFGLRLMHGTGFRAPSLFELYGESDYCVANVCGNSSLNPEESESSDIALIFQPNPDVQFEIASFEVEVSDSIEYGSEVPANAADPCLASNSYLTFSATTCGKYEQAGGESKSTGYEVRPMRQINDATSLTLNFTNLDAVGPSSGDSDHRPRLSRRPENTLNTTIFHNVSERLSVSGSLTMVQDVVDNNNAVLSNYELVNLGVLYQANDDLKLHARLENVGDEDYETALGFGTPGRAAYVGVSASF
jgi:vitamin B12 transporter